MVRRTSCGAMANRGEQTWQTHRGPICRRSQPSGAIHGEGVSTSRIEVHRRAYRKTVCDQPRSPVPNVTMPLEPLTLAGHCHDAQSAGCRNDGDQRARRYGESLRQRISQAFAGVCEEPQPALCVHRRQQDLAGRSDRWLRTHHPEASARHEALTDQIRSRPPGVLSPMPSSRPARLTANN